jgi:hypothetical protein
MKKEAVRSAMIASVYVLSLTGALLTDRLKDGRLCGLLTSVAVLSGALAAVQAVRLGKRDPRMAAALWLGLFLSLFVALLNPHL